MAGAASKEHTAQAGTGRGDPHEQAGPRTRPWRTRLADYGRLMRLDRPIGTLLLLWPTLWALWLAADGPPPPGILAIFVAGVLVMRSAGCVINDLADRDLDPHVERTRDRPLAARRVRPAEALALFAALLLIALALVLLLNRTTQLLAVAGAFLASTYPFMKRVTHLPQLYLGVAFGWGIPMAFAAVTGSVPPLAWILLGANILWALAYDTLYAMTDREDDIRVGNRSSAILFGSTDRWWVLGAQGGTLALLAGVGAVRDLPWPWWLGLAVAAGTIAWQMRLAWSRERAGCFRAFLANNWTGAAIFAGLALALAIR